MKPNYLTENPAQTKKLGECLAKEIIKMPSKDRAFILGLGGDLGSGKTTFLQGFARGLGIKEKVLSPTFVVMKKFQISSSMFQYFYHLDCYRIQKSKEILTLGFKEIIDGPKNIIAIEWAEKIKTLLPKQTIWLKFYFLDNKKRRILISQIKKQ